MRVALLGDYPLCPQHIEGGVEAVLLHLVRGFTQLGGLDLHVITCQAGVGDQQRYTPEGVPLHFLRRHRMGRLTFHLRDVRHLHEVLQEVAPDVVHAHGTGIYATAALGSGYPAVITVHGVVFRETQIARGLTRKMRGALDSLIEHRNLAQARHVIAISPYVEREFAPLTRAWIYHIENPVGDEFFDVASNSGSHIILFVGRLIPRKAPLHLLQAFVRVRKAVPDAQVWFAGEAESDTDYAETLRKFASEHGLQDAVSFLGALDQKALLQTYADCALLVLPSKQETAPIAVAEAMAAGRPVVATRVCGLPYMVDDGRTGLLVDYGDVDGLASAITILLVDEERRRAMGGAAREEAEQRFRPKVVAQRTLETYHQVLKAK
ncbi:MAG: glycosyltransferase family 4 protein [Chloroflexi bacterium]|nr:glycosyltransferase family 4 protein [Chloroflexota bacterium]